METAKKDDLFLQKELEDYVEQEKPRGLPPNPAYRQLTLGSARTQDRAKERSHQEAVGGNTALEPQSQHPAQRRTQEDQESLRKRKAEGEPLGAERVKHRKKGHQDAGDGTKAGKQEQKKKDPGDCSPEWDLWDEAILGACH